MAEETHIPLKPVYEFRWTDGSVRRTDQIQDPAGLLWEEGIELLAELGRDDPECEVRLVGYSN